MGTCTQGSGTRTGTRYLGTAMVRIQTYHEQYCRTEYFAKKIWVRLLKVVRRTPSLGTAKVRLVYKINSPVLKFIKPPFLRYDQFNV